MTATLSTIPLSISTNSYFGPTEYPKLINRQIDRSTDQQSTNLIWDTKPRKKRIFEPTKFVDKFAKKIDGSTDKFGFLGHSIVARVYFDCMHAPREKSQERDDTLKQNIISEIFYG